MNDASIFDSETVVPDDTLSRREGTLLGFEARYARVHDQLRLLLQADALDAWNKRHHGGRLALVERVADQYPLIVFHGDVGTGKTVTAECVANRLMTEAGIEDCTLFRLSNRVRGGGLVGEMGTLLARAFERIVAAAGKNRRAVLIIDEGDSIASSRTERHSHHEDKVAVNTLIQGIDDLRRLRGRVAVVLCTNRLSVLDPAILRRAAIVEAFDRPQETERRELLAMDLEGLKLSKHQMDELVALSGPVDGHPGWTFSDFRTRFYPAAVAKAFPAQALQYAHLRDAAHSMTASRAMEDR